MCTIGVVRLADNDYLLFKNKDFVRQHFDDRLTVDQDVFGAAGVTTWDGGDAVDDNFSGMSVGANRHGLLCCDSNVRTLPDHANYDDLVEIALRQGTDVPSAIKAVEEAVEQRPYLWGNLIMIDAEQSASLEVRSGHVEVVQLEDAAARANHHVVLGAHPENDDTITSQDRFESARERVTRVSRLRDVLDLLRSHDQGETGVCNHSLYQTVYSYVLRLTNGTLTLHITQGKPCESPSPMEMTVPIGATWSAAAETEFRAAYPSNRSSTAA